MDIFHASASTLTSLVPLVLMAGILGAFVLTVYILKPKSADVINVAAVMVVAVSMIGYCSTSVPLKQHAVASELQTWIGAEQHITLTPTQALELLNGAGYSAQKSQSIVFKDHGALIKLKLVSTADNG